MGRNILPFHRAEIGTEERRRMIHMVKRRDRLLAEHAAFSFIPFRNHVPDQAILGIPLDLLQTILTASRPLWPAGTLLQTKRGLVEKDPKCGFSGSDVDGRRLLRLGARHDTLTAPAEQGAHSRDRAEEKESRCQGENG